MRSCLLLKQLVHIVTTLLQTVNLVHTLTNNTLTTPFTYVFPSTPLSCKWSLPFRFSDKTLSSDHRYQSPRPGLNPRPLGPVASTLTTTPPRRHRTSWLTLQLRIREFPVSILGPGNRLSWLCSWISSARPGECRDSTLKLCCDCFLPNPFQFIVIHLSSYHPIILSSSLYSLVTEKASLNKLPTNANSALPVQPVSL
jgi:hypothetical protein